MAAPTKLQKPAGSRVKTDAIDAEHLSMLLRLDAYSALTVPDELTEAARDLVRAREDCRSDLMRARHRLSKLLLRHGIVYSGGQAWVGAHDAWLRRQRFDSPLVQAAFYEAYHSVITITARRDRLDELPLAQVGLVSGWDGIRVLNEAPSSTEVGATLEPFFSPDWGMAFGEQNFRPCDSLGGGLAGVLLACTPGHPIEKLGLVGIIPPLRNRALVSAPRSLAVVQSVARQVDA